MAAEIVQCASCPRRFLTTDQRRPYICVVCRDEDGDDQ